MPSAESSRRWRWYIKASMSCRCKPRVLRRLLTSWCVSGSALSTPPAADPAQGLSYVVLDLAVRDGRKPAADPVHDLEPSFALADHPLELLCADDPDHRDPGFFDQDTHLAALDLLHDLAELRPGFQGWDRLELHAAASVDEN
jgi:hypothetical protein